MDGSCLLAIQHECINVATKTLYFSLHLFCQSALGWFVLTSLLVTRNVISPIVLHISNRKRTAFHLMYGSLCLLVCEGRYSPDCQNLLNKPRTSVSKLPSNLLHYVRILRPLFCIQTRQLQAQVAPQTLQKHCIPGQKTS